MKTLTKTTFLTLVLAFIFAGSAGIVSADEWTGILSSDGGGSGTVVSAPIASPIGGTHTGTQSVTLTAVNAEIRYTINNSEALTCTTGTVYTAGSPISVEVSQLILAISCYSTGAKSNIAEFAYDITEESSNEGSSGSNSSGGSSSSSGGGGGGIATTPSTANYDFNSDGNIDVFDFNILIVNWGSTVATDKTTGDANSDGNVDIFDFNLLIINWQS